MGCVEVCQRSSDPLCAHASNGRDKLEQFGKSQTHSAFVNVKETPVACCCVAAAAGGRGLGLSSLTVDRSDEGKGFCSLILELIVQNEVEKTATVKNVTKYETHKKYWRLLTLTLRPFSK